MSEACDSCRAQVSGSYTNSVLLRWKRTPASQEAAQAVNALAALTFLFGGFALVMKSKDETEELTQCHVLCAKCRSQFRPPWGKVFWRVLIWWLVTFAPLAIFFRVVANSEVAIGILVLSFLCSPILLFLALRPDFRDYPVSEGFTLTSTSWDLGYFLQSLIPIVVLCFLGLGYQFVRMFSADLRSTPPPPPKAAPANAYSTLPKVVVQQFQGVDREIAAGNHRQAAELAESLLADLKVLGASGEPLVRAHRSAAQAYTKLNQKKQAKAHYKSLLSLDRTHAAEYKKALKQLR